jgi:hypothetical protein
MDTIFDCHVHKSLLILTPCVAFCNMLAYGEEMLAPSPTSKLVYHPLSAIRDCLLSVFIAAFHIWRSSSPPATQRRAMRW